MGGGAFMARCIFFARLRGQLVDDFLRILTGGAIEPPHTLQLRSVTGIGDEMRAVWQQTPGALEWLRAHSS